MLRTEFKYEKKKRAITQKLSKQELRFMCTVLPVDEIYPPTKFHNSKIKQARVMVPVHCTPP